MFIKGGINLLVQSYYDEVENRFKGNHSFDFNSLKLLDGNLYRFWCFIQSIRNQNCRIRRLDHWHSSWRSLRLHIHVLILPRHLWRHSSWWTLHKLILSQIWRLLRWICILRLRKTFKPYLIPVNFLRIPTHFMVKLLDIIGAVVIVKSNVTTQF